MLRKISFTLLCVVALLSTPIYSTTVHELRQGVTLEYDLPTNEPQLFVNYMFWSIEGNCKITFEGTPDEKIDLFIEGMAKKGSINDVPISNGQTMLLKVPSGDIIKMKADSGAKIRITNLSGHMVKATCTA